MRLNHFIASATDLSRRAADLAIRQGRITVDGQPGKVGQNIQASQVVTCDGQTIQTRLHQATILLHKPVGYVSSRRQQGSHSTVFDLLPPDLQHLQIAGRLDQDSSGLLVLTSDGQLLYTLTHPKFAKVKTYEVTLTRPLSDQDRQRLTEGVVLSDGLSQLFVTAVEGRHVVLNLSEGRNRQIRRTFGALDYGITRLHRTSIGPYQLANLPAGEWQLAHVRGVRHA